MAEIDLKTIAMIESSDNFLAYNRKSGATGKYQITKICLQDYKDHHPTCEYTMQDMYSPISSIVADWYLNERIPQMLRHYNMGASLDNILASYNFGIGNVVKAVKSGKAFPTETVNYINKYKERVK